MTFNEFKIFLMRLMTDLLIVLYGAAWGVNAMWPAKGWWLLLGGATVVTLPYYGLSLAIGVLTSAIISVIIAILTLISPLIGAAAAVLIGIIMGLFRLGSCAMNVPVLAAGFAMYGILKVPQTAGIALIAFDAESLTRTVVAVALASIGICLIFCVIRLFERCRYERTDAAALMLGVASYIVIMIASVFIPYLKHHLMPKL